MRPRAALRCEAGDLLTCNEFQATSEFEQVAELGRRAQGYRQEVQVVSCRSARTAFNDIGGHRHRGAPKLRLQPNARSSRGIDEVAQYTSSTGLSAIVKTLSLRRSPLIAALKSGT